LEHFKKLQGNLEFHQNKWHPRNVPAWSARFYVGLVHGFLDTCLHEKGKAKGVEKVGGGLSTRPAGHIGGAPPRHYKYPPTNGNQNIHHILKYHVQ
jgi:hypothetical protein